MELAQREAAKQLQRARVAEQRARADLERSKRQLQVCARLWRAQKLLVSVLSVQDIAKSKEKDNSMMRKVGERLVHIFLHVHKALDPLF